MQIPEQSTSSLGTCSENAIVMVNGFVILNVSCRNQCQSRLLPFRVSIEFTFFVYVLFQGNQSIQRIKFFISLLQSNVIRSANKQQNGPVKISEMNLLLDKGNGALYALHKQCFLGG